MAASPSWSSARVAPRSVIRVAMISSMTARTSVAVDSTAPVQDMSPTVRYRTVGDMSCTGAVESTATDVRAVIEEIIATRITERGATRADDQLGEAAMEDRKREGYF